LELYRTFRKTFARNDLGLVVAAWWREVTSNGTFIGLSVFFSAGYMLFYTSINSIILWLN